MGLTEELQSIPRPIKKTLDPESFIDPGENCLWYDCSHKETRDKNNLKYWD